MAFEEQGYTSLLPEPLMREESGRYASARVARHGCGLRKRQSRIDDADAQLDVQTAFIGYAAAGRARDTPYRPTVHLIVRLVAADGQSVLFSDPALYHALRASPDAVTFAPTDGKYTYPKFDHLETAGEKAIEGLRQAICETVRRLAQLL